MNRPWRLTWGNYELSYPTWASAVYAANQLNTHTWSYSEKPRVWKHR